MRKHWHCYSALEIIMWLEDTMFDGYMELQTIPKECFEWQLVKGWQLQSYFAQLEIALKILPFHSKHSLVLDVKIGLHYCFWGMDYDKYKSKYDCMSLLIPHILISQVYARRYQSPTSTTQSWLQSMLLTLRKYQTYHKKLKCQFNYHYKYKNCLDVGSFW